jgi:membrane protein implicated in regulation of membrane protease activity
MKSLLSAPVVWFIIGFVFFLLEFMVPGLILFFFAVGAWVVAVLTFLMDVSINTQLMVFVASSVLTILLFRRSLKKLLWTRKNNSEIEDELIGKTARAQTSIRPGQNGKVEFKGTIWDAASQDIIEKDENVVIVGNESILLIVKSTKAI